MHYSVDDLSQLRAHTTDDPRRAAMEAHLAGCSDCRETLAFFDEVENGLRSREVWENVALFAAPPAGVEQALAEKAAIERDDADATRRLSPLLKSAMHFDEARILGDTRFHHAGVVRVLVAKAATEREQSPKFALRIANAACEIARRIIEPLRFQGLLLARALRERANALRFLGEFHQALATLDEAEGILRRLPEGAFDLAIVAYIRSTVVIQFEERSEEALALAQAAARVFREFHDIEREMAARLAEAIALRRLHGSAAAAEAYETIISTARAAGEKNILAYAYQNAAVAYAELADLDKAERYYLEALALYDELGVAVEKARVEWELGRMLALRGRLHDATSALYIARRKLFELGLRDDHALATLDWVSLRLATDRSEGVAEACREIIVHFKSEGATRNARLALAHLTEALRAGQATPALAQSVRAYLEDLARHPGALFSPPAA